MRARRCAQHVPCAISVTSALHESRHLVSFFTRRRRCCGCRVRQRSSAFSFFEGPAEAVGLRAGLDDVRPIGNAVDQRLAEPGIRNHLSPFRERQVAGHDYCRLLGPFRDHLEQELRADFRQRHITDLIDCDKVVASPARHGTTELQLMLGLDQFVDQRCRSREAYPALLPAGRNRQSGEQMSLAGPAVAYKDDGLSPCDIAAFGELVNLLRRDLRALREVEFMLSST